MIKLRAKLRVAETGDEARACGDYVVVGDVLFVCKKCGKLSSVNGMTQDILCGECQRTIV